MQDKDALAESFDNDSIQKEVVFKVKLPLMNIISDRDSHVFKTNNQSPNMMDTVEPEEHP